MVTFEKLQQYLIMHFGSKIQDEIENLCVAAILEEREACAAVAADFAAKTLSDQPPEFARGAHWVSAHLPYQIRNRT